MQNIKEKQELTKALAYLDKLRVEMVQIARLGVSGDIERLRIQVLRCIRAVRDQDESFAILLQSAVFPHEGTATRKPIRSLRREAPGLSLPLPTDSESEHELLRVEDPPVMPHELVQSITVMRRLGQLLMERTAVVQLAKANMQPTRTVLFTGPPGVGKTLAARYLAIQLGVPLLVLDLASVISSFLGKTGSNIKQAFAYAKRSPCVFFLDEIDAVAKRRDDDSDVGELKRLVTVLLQEIDLWPSSNLLVAATNHPALLDTAVWRRFESTIEFLHPTASDLIRLSEQITTSPDPVTTAWKETLARLSEGASQSDFIRDLNYLRRTTLLGGIEQGRLAFEEIISAKVESAKTSDRKKIARVLVKEAHVSQREASRISRLARETVRQALQEE